MLKKTPVKPVKELPKEKAETYFVSIRNPQELRRQVLECTRKTLQSLQNYHRIMLIREQKLKELESLKASLKELAYLNKKLNEKLPEYDYYSLVGGKPEEPIEKVLKKSEPPKAVKPVKEPPREKTDLEKLEDSLAVIENRLKTLKKP